MSAKGAQPGPRFSVSLPVKGPRTHLQASARVRRCTGVLDPTPMAAGSAGQSLYGAGLGRRAAARLRSGLGGRGGKANGSGSAVCDDRRSVEAPSDRVLGWEWRRAGAWCSGARGAYAAAAAAPPRRSTALERRSHPARSSLRVPHSARGCKAVGLARSPGTLAVRPPVLERQRAAGACGMRAAGAVHKAPPPCCHRFITTGERHSQKKFCCV